ncbi:hypothetical protein [Xenorhabdus hominickii]|uniref:Transposase n=1 Tax=Xenorhabdus hominickii TaxID=351679 RepID=A0ABM6DPB0_XENHO|nr:hypothetical protein [Xenorhabdus hominickii]AOM39790.1 hypothetical protein A9255_03880 [Xenorhabdus hominickii]
MFTYRVVGMAMSSSPDADLMCSALNNALETRCIEGGLFSTGHSKKPMKRLFRSLKNEWVPPEGYRDIYKVVRDIT